jgi:hypothetical protein
LWSTSANASDRLLPAPCRRRSPNHYECAGTEKPACASSDSIKAKDDWVKRFANDEVAEHHRWDPHADEGRTSQQAAQGVDKLENFDVGYLATQLGASAKRLMVRFHAALKFGGVLRRVLSSWPVARSSMRNLRSPETDKYEIRLPP